MNIRKIEAQKQEVKKLRVAAYCRVSTVNEEQATNYEAQIAHLREVQAQTVMDDAAKAEHKKRIRELRAFIRSQPHGIAEFDEMLVKHLVERVTVQEDRGGGYGGEVNR